jgi:RNA polymerase sigma factor (sigma-70 family)
MAEVNDYELLREYARNGSEAAFATLVGRYINLVYSAALRFTRNPHHAEEIAQAVFIVLARKAGSLRSGTVLAGWLYQTARLTAANFVRGEIRRQRREQEAYMQSSLNEPDTAAWEQVSPLLDDAMGRLGETDRNAVVLRFFENKTNREVGAALKLTEAAAQQRVSRALEKLRKIFHKRGVALSAAVIASAVSANSVQAAPASLVAAITNGMAAGGSIATLASETMSMLIWAKIKSGLVVGVPAAAVTAVIVSMWGSKTPGVGIVQSGSVEPPTAVAGSGPPRNIAATPAYELIKLDPIPGFNSIHVNGLNNRGQLVGSLDSTNNQTHAFVWENGVMTDLGTFGGSKCLASGINDAGQIVGTILTNGERHAFLLQKGELSDLGIIDHFAKLGDEGDSVYYTSRVTINDRSEVAGHLMDGNNNSRSFLLNNDRTSYFGLIGDGNIFYAEAINNRGQVLGRATQRDRTMRSMLWQNGELIDLGALDGTRSVATAINDAGTVVGWSGPTNSTQQRAFAWDNGRLRRLNTGNSTSSHASAINNLGRVVGYAKTSQGRQYACLWNGNDMLDLNDLLEMKSGWHLSGASAINDRGQILAVAVKSKERRTCLLSPVKLPPTLEAPVTLASAVSTNSIAAIEPFNLTSFERLPNGAFRLGFAGKPDAKYVVEASTNLTDWTVLGPAPNDGGKVEFVRCRSSALHAAVLSGGDGALRGKLWTFWRAEHFESAERGGGAGLDAESGENFHQMFLHRLFADAQDRCDFGIGLPLRHPQKDFGDARSEAEIEQRLVRGEVRLKLRPGLLILAFQSGLDRLQQIGFGNRLGEVIVSAQIHAAADIRPFPFCGQKDEGNGHHGGIGPEGFEDSIPAKLGHHDVAEDEVGLFALGQFDPDAAVFGAHSLKLFETQNRHEVAAHLRLVLDYENFHFRSEHRKNDGNCRALIHFTGDRNFAAVEFDAFFYDDKPKARAGTVAHVATPMKSVEKPLAILLRYADSAVLNAQDEFSACLGGNQSDRLAGRRIFYRIRNEIGQDMAQQPLVHFGFVRPERNG